MPVSSRPQFHVAPGYQPLMRVVGLDAEGVFTHPDIKVWRSITERENCTLDCMDADRKNLRLHIKRYHAASRKISPAQEEARGIQALMDAAIATVPLVGWGELPDGRSFIISMDLAGYEAADKLLAGGARFDRLRDPTADVAAKLHDAGLHHRDLYLCHFFARVEGEEVDLRLIDAARVRLLPAFLTRRWIVKDLAQFWYSGMQAGVLEEQRRAWLERYARQRRLERFDGLLRSVIKKAAWIARHDAKLRAVQPDRNVSIPR